MVTGSIHLKDKFLLTIAIENALIGCDVASEFHFQGKRLSKTGLVLLQYNYYGKYI